MRDGREKRAECCGKLEWTEIEGEQTPQMSPRTRSFPLEIISSLPYRVDTLAPTKSKAARLARTALLPSDTGLAPTPFLPAAGFAWRFARLRELGPLRGLSFRTGRCTRCAVDQ